MLRPRYHGSMLGNIGPLEILVVLIIALVVFGPKRLPELGSSLGRGIREFRDSVSGEKHHDEEDEPSRLERSNGVASSAEEKAEREVVSDKRT
jgi:sec-independent protein translocase protein TatA